MGQGVGNSLTAGSQTLNIQSPYGPLGSSINQASQQTGLPQPVIWGMIQQESQGDPNIVNPDSGATGLMQVLPSTYQKPGYGMPENLTPDPQGQLKDPHTNIMFGSQYLASIGRGMFGKQWNPNDAVQLRQALDKYSGGAKDYTDLVFRKGGFTEAQPQVVSDLGPNALSTVRGPAGGGEVPDPANAQLNAIWGPGAGGPTSFPASVGEAGRTEGTPNPAAGIQTMASRAGTGTGPTGGQLGLPQSPQMDYMKMMRAQMAMGMLQRLLPQGMKFEPIAYNPFQVLKAMPPLGGRAPAIPVQSAQYPELPGVQPFRGEGISPGRIPRPGQRGAQY